LIKLTRSQPDSSRNTLIHEAYRAYQAGDYSQAEEKYLQAYRVLPDNRDVLLGMAAIAIQKGNDAQAMDIYLKLLRLDPFDNIARAAVLGYQSGDNSTTTDSISAIKSMLYEYPDQPLLYFNLGKLYATRSSWAEAQQAFFDAYRLDTDNPDYALNLAVSLDKLGQKQAALGYYNAAVELAGNSPSGFESEKVLSRIRTLTSGN
jgi:Flp pilus assembly protein TadD